MISSASRVHDPRVSFRDTGSHQLEGLCDAVGLGPRDGARASALFDFLTQPWNSHPVGSDPPWPTDICDDGSPFEFSLAFEKNRAQVRLLLESQQAPFNVHSSWDAGIELCERLRRTSQADLRTFERVRDLFQPTHVVTSRFALWHAAVFDPAGANLFKVYMNPQIAGAAAAPQLLEEACGRLGLGQSWQSLTGELSGRVAPSDFRYFSVDLDKPEAARAKIYVATTTTEGADALVRCCNNFKTSRASEWLRHLTGSDGPYLQRPILICFSFKPNRSKPDATIHVPIRCYVTDDAQALERISPILAKEDAERLTSAVVSLAQRPLESARGLITYASISCQNGTMRTTAYLAPQLYSPGSAGFHRRDSRHASGAFQIV